ncbi:hypothetical protein IFM89_008065 [Coptis chinensis]|uniref:WRKY domain-containing protein n=1 Tax=Coptis chinensis TaxID=261450 RepID=A0A835MC24_9MAGN|nr:hypothetical protein IFM89_008065 [Coptis chinensis]
MDEEKSNKSESSWVDSPYFYGTTENETSILSEFGWNLGKNHESSSLLEFNHQIEQGSSDCLAGMSSSLVSTTCSLVEKSGDASTSNPSVSSSSSDEQPEKSTGSDGKPLINREYSKGRKKGQKRARQQRFAFMTKSDVDHLEDGYRWRKYGQKAVKNSPYPRSYYRCTNSKCTVKKRVERSCEDPTIVITTYEGQHCHHTVSFPRGGLFSHEGPFVGQLNPPASQVYAPAVQYPTGGPLGVTQLHQLQREVRPSQMQPELTSQHSSDEGLLGDIVPPGMRNR